ncbi:hypothetical protein ACFL1P_00745 [Patescibacteria group bacterium]
MTVPEVVGTIIINFFSGLMTSLPQFVAGLLLIIIGVIVASVFRRVFEGLLHVLKLEEWLKHIHLHEKLDIKVWEHYLAELLRWSILVLFLVAAVETWGMPAVGDLLNDLLLYLPNVFIAVFMGFIGVIVASLTQDFVKHSAKGLGAKSAKLFSNIARYAVLIFVSLLMLHQLGVASDLIQILFTGIVAMIALAGGLAFGLGGQDMAKKVLGDFYQNHHSKK